jgi:transposase-like protein
LSCYTYTEIAKELDVDRTTVSGWVEEETGNLAILQKFSALSTYTDPDWELAI